MEIFSLAVLLILGLGPSAYALGKKAGYRSVWIWVVLAALGYLYCFVAGYNAPGMWGPIEYIGVALIVVTPAAIAAILGAVIGAFHKEEMARKAARQSEPASTE
ncbi:hypothetical protein [Octadecabacter sp. R77987]|uniref:hypothetical protein n=1 Tax=Octadecabacter sp. R77987 TaxID=3093874 RepID=UPI00366E1DA5